MKNMILILLLFLNYFNSYKLESIDHSIDSYEIDIKKDPEELVNLVIERFDKISETSADLAEKLKKISEASAAFLKLGIPLGGLIAASLDIVSKPESPEYKALKKLSTHMTYQFERLSERITYSFEVEEMDREMLDFTKFITIRLNVLSEKVMYFIDPSVAKDTEDINDLLVYCKGEKGIEEMADYMKTRIAVGCELENTEVYVKISNLWRKLENKYNKGEWDHKEIHTKKRILRAIYTIRANKALKLIQEAENVLFGEMEHVLLGMFYNKLNFGTLKL
uniref:Uncharacterized protein n=1 Tax=Meloidogyne hapla TaxID=6305 RepID=A0A1I8BY19_MELHA